MSIFIEKNGKKVLPVSFYIKILAFWGLIGLSAVVMQPLHALFNQGMEQIRSDFIQNLEELTGMEIHYSSIRPAFFGSFDIRNINFFKDNEPFFTVARIHIGFSMSEFLFNQKMYINTVQIIRPNLHINLNRDSNTLDYLLSLFNGRSSEDAVSQQLSDFLQQQAVLQIRNGSFTITDGQSIYKIEGVHLNIREDDGQFILDGNLFAEINYANLPGRTITIKTEVNINGVCDEKLENGSGGIGFAFINCYEQSITRNTTFFRPAVNNSPEPQDLFTISPFKTALNYKNKTLRINHEDENNASFYQFIYDTEVSSLSADITLDDFCLGEIINLSDNLTGKAGFNYFYNLINMHMTGSSSFKYKDGLIDYFVNLSGTNLPAAADGILINVTGNNETVIVDNLLYNSSVHGTLGFYGEIEINPFRPDGILFFDNFTISAKDDLHTSLFVTSEQDEIRIFGPEILIGETFIKNLDIFLYPAENDISLFASAFFRNEGSVFINALYNFNPAEAEVSLAIDRFSVFEITEILRPFTGLIHIPFFSRAQLQESLLSADVFFSTDFNNILFNAPNVAFNFGDTSGILSFSGTDRQITLSDSIIYFKENELLTSANLNFANPMELNFIFNTSYKDMSWRIEGYILDRTTLIINDPLGLYVYGNISGSGAMTGYIETDNFALPLNNRTIFLNSYTALRYNSADFWNLDINYLTARDSNTTIFNGEEFLKISGIADQNGAHFRDVLYRDSAGTLLGSAQFSWDMDFSFIEITAGFSDETSGKEAYYLEGVYRDEIINISASVENMHLNRFIDYNETILLSASFSAVWNSIDSFNARLNLSSLITRVQNNPVSASAVINFSGDELIVQDLKMELKAANIFLSELIVNRAEGRANGNFKIEGYNREKRMHVIAGINIDFHQVDSWVNIREASDRFKGTLVVKDLQYGNDRNDEMTFVFSGSEGDLSFSGGIKNMIRLEMDRNGNFFAGLSSPLPIQGTVIGTFDKGFVDAYINNFYLDLQQIYALAAHDVDTFNISGGYITGQMNIIGHFLNPEMYGYGIATSTRIDVQEYLETDIMAVPFEIHVEGHYMTFDSVVVSSGTGSANVGGWFYFSNWIPTSIGLDIKIPRENPVPYNFKMSGFSARGNASGYIQLDVDTVNYLIQITGDVFTNEAELVLINMQDVSDNADIQYRMNSIVDIRITTGSMVDFMWPQVNPIIRANPEMGTVINISSDTQTGQFSINSDVNIRSGEVYYFERSFYIRQAAIVLRENESQFNPRLTARAEIRDRADTGPVTIFMIVENQPLLTFEPRFESSPGLTQLEIYTILGQNFNSLQDNENPEMAQRMFLSSTADILTQLMANSETFAQFMFFRQFERQVRDLFRLDMFSIRTRFFHNAVILGATGLGQDPVDRNYTVGNYFDNTTVFMGKYIGRDIFVHGMLTIRYDEYRIENSGLVFEPDIGIEFHTPYLNIRWDFFPLHPENWWASDNSITLSWGRSF